MFKSFASRTAQAAFLAGPLLALPAAADQAPDQAPASTPAYTVILTQRPPNAGGIANIILPAPTIQACFNALRSVFSTVVTETSMTCLDAENRLVASGTCSTAANYRQPRCRITTEDSGAFMRRLEQPPSP